MSASEKHFSIKEIAELWRLSRGAVRTLFHKRSDVLRIGHGETRYKRGYITLRIPESVVQRVYDELKRASR